MKLRETIQKIWENKSEIAEGFYNRYLSMDKDIKEEAARRLTICKQNTCGYWDETGTHERLAIKGSPGCTGCGCNGEMKTNCMSCQCYLGDINPDTGQPRSIPLWEAVLTDEQDKHIGQITYENQFKKKEQ